MSECERVCVQAEAEIKMKFTSNKLSVDPIDLSKWQACFFYRYRAFPSSTILKKISHDTKCHIRNAKIITFSSYDKIETDTSQAADIKPLKMAAERLSLYVNGTKEKENSINNCYQKTKPRFNMQEVVGNVKQYTRDMMAGGCGRNKAIISRLNSFMSWQMLGLFLR